MWSITDAVELATAHLAGMGDRWSHVSRVGETAQALAQKTELVNDGLVAAAWLHDIGYSPELVRTGCHPLDGARFLAFSGFSDEVVALVAHHTGAAFEAEERQLLEAWRTLPVPEGRALDILTMIDLAVGPAGQPQLDVDRVAGILSRYSEIHPVHRAVSRSRAHLLAASARGKKAVGLPDDWPLVGECVDDAKPHGGMEL